MSFVSYLTHSYKSINIFSSIILKIYLNNNVTEDICANEL